MVGPPRVEGAVLLCSKHQACQWLDIFLSRPQIHTSSVAYFSSKQAVFIYLFIFTNAATSQAGKEGQHENQGTDTCLKGC